MCDLFTISIYPVDWDCMCADPYLEVSIFLVAAHAIRVVAVAVGTSCAVATKLASSLPSRAEMKFNTRGENDPQFHKTSALVQYFEVI